VIDLMEALRASLKGSAGGKALAKKAGRKTKAAPAKKAAGKRAA
jgi:hypothetical protein